MDEFAFEISTFVYNVIKQEPKFSALFENVDCIYERKGDSVVLYWKSVGLLSSQWQLIYQLVDCLVNEEYSFTLIRIGEDPEDIDEMYFKGEKENKREFSQLGTKRSINFGTGLTHKLFILR